jgi:Predicted membrane protein (DUF2232)
MTVLLVGLGAGLVSALLFAVVVTGSALAVGLSLVAPLPIFIAALGWSHRAGLVAVAAGGVATALAFRPAAGMAFGLGWALPAWWLAFLALLGRSRAEGALEWYPLGRVLLWIAAAAALVTLFAVVALGSGDYGSYRDAMRQALEAFLRIDAGSPAASPLPAPSGLSAAEILNGFIAAFPAFLASSFALILALNLWLAARVVAISGRLARPWPFIPETAMPRGALLALGGGVAAALLPGFVGAAGLAVIGALGVAFALQGLALMHDLSRGRSGRGLLLASVYAFALFLSQIALPVLALAGIADSAFGLRKPRIGRRPDP